MINTLRNRVISSTWNNTRKGSINNLPQMTITNLNQMQNK